MDPWDTRLAENLAELLRTFPDVTTARTPDPLRESAVQRLGVLGELVAGSIGHGAGLRLELRGRTFALRPVERRHHRQGFWQPRHVAIVVFGPALPVHLTVCRRRTASAMPRFWTGDRAFDWRFITRASPLEVASAFLDEEVRRTLQPLGQGLTIPVLSFPGPETILRYPFRTGPFSHRPVATAQEARAAVELAFRLSDRMADTFGRMYADAERRLGAQGAARWAQELETTYRDASRRSARRWTILLIVIVLLSFVAVLVGLPLLFATADLPTLLRWALGGR